MGVVRISQEPASSTGRPRTVDLMSVVQAILYVLVTGCAWRLLPNNYPPLRAVYYYFRQWRSGWNVERYPRSGMCNGYL